MFFYASPIASYFGGFVNGSGFVFEHLAKFAFNFARRLEADLHDLVRIDARQCRHTSICQFADAAHQVFFALGDYRDRFTARSARRSESHVEAEAPRQLGDASRNNRPHPETLRQSAKFFLREFGAVAAPERVDHSSLRRDRHFACREKARGKQIRKRLGQVPERACAVGSEGQDRDRNST